MKKVLNLILLAGFLLLMTERPAHAYLDAGMGSMILQVLLGGVAGAYVIFKFYWRQFVALFSRRQDEDDALDTPQT